MARRNSYGTSLREHQRAERAYQQALKAQEKEKARLYTESRMTAVDLKNKRLEQEIAQLESLLTATLSVDDYLDFESLKKPSNLPIFDSKWTKPELANYLPPDLSAISKLLPHLKNVTQKKLRLLEDGLKPI